MIDAAEGERAPDAAGDLPNPLEPFAHQLASPTRACDNAFGMHDPTPELRALVQGHAAPVRRELLSNLTLWSSYGPTPPTPVLYEPMLYFTLQGIKRMTVGEHQLDHRPGTFCSRPSTCP